MVDVRNVIKFGDDRLKGLGSAEGQSSPFPIDFVIVIVTTLWHYRVSAW